jgi:hypothetical protein
LVEEITGKKKPPIKPDIHVVTTKRSETQIDRYLRMVRQINAQMKLGIAPPRCDSFACTKNYCGYWDVCKARFNTY